MLSCQSLMLASKNETNAVFFRLDGRIFDTSVLSMVVKLLKFYTSC